MHGSGLSGSRKRVAGQEQGVEGRGKGVMAASDALVSGSPRYAHLSICLGGGYFGSPGTVPGHRDPSCRHWMTATLPTRAVRPAANRRTGPH